MDLARTDDAEGRAWKGLRAPLRTGAVTAAVFAAGALLALILVGSRFESRAILSFTEGTQPTLPQAEALVQAREFETALAAKSNGDGDGSREPPTLRRALLALMEGRGLDAGDPVAEIVSLRPSTVEERPGGAGFVLTVRTSRPEDANRLAEAAAGLLVQRLAEMDVSVSAGDQGELTLAREELAALQREAATDPAAEAETASIDARRLALQSEEREWEERIEASDRRLARLRALEADASAVIPADATELPGLDARLERYRTLRAAVEELATTLPPESPRLRIARGRLDELAGEVRSGAAALRESEEDDRRALDRRRAAASGEIEVLDGRASERRGHSERAVRMAQAEARVNALEAATARPRAAVGTIEGPLTIRQPFLTAGLLAALAGFALGAATSVAGRSANRDRGLAPVAEASNPDEADGGDAATGNSSAVALETDERPAAPEAITLDEAVAALSASRISRSLVVAVSGVDHPSASLRLSRALAADGQLVLLIDLSPSQRAAREAGVPAGADGFADVVAGSLSLSSVTFNDEDSSADIVAAGQGAGGPSAWIEALGFARRAYDQVVVDCGTSAARDLLALADENAAVLVAVQGAQEPEGLTARLAEFESAGLDTAILRV